MKNDSPLLHSSSSFLSTPTAAVSPPPPATSTATMGSEASPHMFFFPFMSAGHMLPMLNMAANFARRGARATVLATPSNASLVAAAVLPSDAGLSLSFLILPLPSPSDAGLPDGWDASSSVSLTDMSRLHRAIALLRPALLSLLADHRPDCLVSDMFLPWTAQAAAELNIPRLIFHGMSLFALCVIDRIKLHRPGDSVSRDDEPFLVPGLPCRVVMTRAQLPEPLRARNHSFSGMMEAMREAEKLSYGVLINSFREMEPGFAEHHHDIIGKKAWHVGPVSLYKEKERDQSDNTLKWLDGVEQSGSVLYVCFGSLSQFSAEQLREIAVGLDASGQRFVWVVKGEGVGEWLPEGWNREGKGLLINGWAPQIEILNHAAVVGFITHCGWNSVLEGVSAGLPLITWPVFGDQFFNEMLVVDVLEIGVRVEKGGEAVAVTAREVEKAVRRVIGEEGEVIRKRAKRLGEMANGAMKEGGSSYDDMGRLMEEMMSVKMKQVDIGEASQ